MPLIPPPRPPPALRATNTHTAMISAVGTSDTSSDWTSPGPWATGDAETETFCRVISCHSPSSSAKAGLYVLNRT